MFPANRVVLVSSTGPGLKDTINELYSEFRRSTESENMFSFVVDVVECGRFSLSVEEAYLMLGLFRWKYLSTWIWKISVQPYAVWRILFSRTPDTTCSYISVKMNKPRGENNTLTESVKYKHVDCLYQRSLVWWTGFVFWGY